MKPNATITAALTGSRHQDSHIDGLQRFAEALAARGIELEFESRFAGYLESCGASLPASARRIGTPSAGTGCIISFGGDGTFLRAAHWGGAASIPVLGVNTGHLGFLSPYTLGDAVELAAAIASGSMAVEERLMLQVSGADIPDGVWPYAANEVAILKEDTSSMITVHTTFRGSFLADYLADGLIISTPTGSTAYNLSAGGPIVQPTLDCRVLSPIAPHSLTMRPLVIDAGSEVRALTTSRADTYRVSLDGRSFVMRCGTEVCVTRAPFRLRVMRREGDSFADTLRQKLLWGASTAKAGERSPGEK